MKMINKIIVFLITVSILLFPDIRLGYGLPALQVVDFLLPIIFISLIINRKRIIWNRFYSFLLIFSGYIIVTIIVNERLGMVKDYFEIYKVLKFLLIILFFSVVEIKKFKRYYLYPIFALLVFFNLGHYFNVFGINELIKNFSYFLYRPCRL